MIFKIVSFLVLDFDSIAIFRCLCLAQNEVRPATVNVGALVAYNTTIGRVAKKAIELALEDVNNDKTVLNGTQLAITMMDSNCSAFIATSAGFPSQHYFLPKVFQKGSPLQIDISRAILKLSETGELQSIHDKSLSVDDCISHVNQDGPKQLGLTSFWSLFLISGVASFAALLGFVCHLSLQFRRHPRTSDDLRNFGSLLRKFVSFVDRKEIDQRDERSKRRWTEEQGERNQITSESTSSHQTI